MSNITPFSFEQHHVRTIEQDGQAWFVLNDVTEALEFSRGRNAARMLDDDEKGAHIVSTPGGEQEITIINESGLYSLVLKSRKPSAKRFKKWVTAEVLPAIRKTGRYESPKPATLTPAQQRHIQNRVAELARSPGNSFTNVYRSIKDQFQVGSYKDVPAERYPALCHYLMTAPLEGELVEGQQQAVTQGQHSLTDSQMYEVYFTALHFTQLHRIFRESRLYDHLTGLGSRIGIEMVDHFTDGGAMAAGLLRQHAAEFEAIQRRLRVNAYR
ncbi:Bro-N domain-containing protein [Ectopseudomonas oleovorans]|uniref:BRO-N domain-containing protein n=1 Tax=Ectopseudomonas oleovorans TaxID=301 RepID=UPI00241CA610|nr:Bro-N domain-containing protein [Pseudomonas oleovorans]